MFKNPYYDRKKNVLRTACIKIQIFAERIRDFCKNKPTKWLLKFPCLLYFIYYYIQ